MRGRGSSARVVAARAFRLDGLSLAWSKDVHDGGDRAARVLRPVHAARARDRAAAVEPARRPVLYGRGRGDGGRLRDRRLLPVRDARHLPEPEGDQRRTRTRRSSASTPSSGTRRSTGGSSSSRSIATAVLVVLGSVAAALGAGRAAFARRHLARPPDLVLAVELRGAARRRDRRLRRRLAVARARRGRRRRPVVARGDRGRPAAGAAIAAASHDNGLNHATSGRGSLVANGIRIAGAHPVLGVGVGGFKRAYAKSRSRARIRRRRVAQHTGDGGRGGGLIGPRALRVARRRASSSPAFRRLDRSLAGELGARAGLVLARDLRHSLFYNEFFEDPMTWALFGLVALVSPELVPARAARPVRRREEPVPV